MGYEYVYVSERYEFEIKGQHFYTYHINLSPSFVLTICMPVLPYLTVGTFTGDDNNFVRSLHSWTNLTRFASVDTATYSFSSSNDVTSALPPSSLSMSF